MNSNESATATVKDEPVIKKTQLCKCGKKAEFIKDYWVTENKLLKEKDSEDTITRKLENACGILRRRYCGACLGKIAANQRRINKKLNFRIVISIMIPLLLGTALSAVSYFVLDDKSSLFNVIGLSALTVAAAVILPLILSGAQRKRKKVERGIYKDTAAVEAILDSLNFALSDPSLLKELPSTDVIVDGDGRVNYEMERSGYYMKVRYDGKISMEPMRQRILYPFSGDSEYIKKTYTIAGLLDDNIRSKKIKEQSDKDFDIRGGVLHRYSGLAVEVKIPDGVTKIAVGAFKNSKNCEKITMPDTVTEIEKEAFLSCPVGDIRFSVNLKSIGSFAFYKSGIASAVLPEGLEKIEDNAFGECYALQQLSVPGSVAKISEAAFKNCVSLEKAELAEGIESITDYAFNGCRALKEINVPEGCYELGNFAFEGCAALEKVFLPDTIQFVGGRVFEGDVHLCIYGRKNSFAEKYAAEQRLRFSLINDEKFKLKKTHKTNGR